MPPISAMWALATICLWVLTLVNECIGYLSSAKKRNQPTSFRKTNLPRNRLQIRQELQSLSALYSGTLDLTHERCNVYAEHSLRPTFI